MNRLRAMVSLGALLCACSGATPGGANVSQVPAADSEVGAAVAAASKPRPSGDPQPRLPVGVVEFEAPAPRAPLTLQVEVASTDEQRQMGLMFREQLGESEGMLFLFPSERRQSFWMRNTLIPLDMFFIDSDWTVVGVVENAEPLTDTPRGVAKMSRYVLETNAGFARRHGFGAGQKIRFVPPEEVP
jgi:uncharacterized membrane protein (UPF0127 family)